MTKEDAMDYLARSADGSDPEYDAAVALAVSALRAQVEAERNEPLTVEELRGMVGEPVYLHFGENIGEWVLIRVYSEPEKGIFLTHKNGICAPAKIAFESGAKLYRHKPLEPVMT